MLYRSRANPRPDGGFAGPPVSTPATPTIPLPIPAQLLHENHYRRPGDKNAASFNPKAMPTPRPLLVLLAAYALTTAGAHAHDPYQGWTSADLRTDGTMLISLTIGQGAARNLLEPKPEVYFTEDNFAEYHAPLKAQALNLFTVTSNGTTLAPKTAESILTDEADVTFIITYPRPAPGALHIKANYLQKMEDGHVDTLEVVEGTRASYGMADLDVEHPALDLTLPASLPATRFPAAPPTASPPQGASSSYAPPPGTPFPVSTPSKPATAAATTSSAPAAPSDTSPATSAPVANTASNPAVSAPAAAPATVPQSMPPTASPLGLQRLISFFSHNLVATVVAVILIGFFVLRLSR